MDFHNELNDDTTYQAKDRSKRIRTRLDHLTPEEKLERRKEKNRQAAQSSRERKRTRLEQLAEENRRLREENQLLKAKLEELIWSSQDNAISTNVPLILGVDSGISSADSSIQMTPPPPASTGVAPIITPSLASNFYIDSIIGQADDVKLIEDIHQLERLVYNDTKPSKQFKSEALIRASQQQGSSASVENSTGWTAVQLMLLLMIARVHRRFAVYKNCCLCEQQQPVLNGLELTPSISPSTPTSNENFYDFIMGIQCPTLRKGADLIIANKNNTPQQHLVTLKFIHRYLYGNTPATSNN